MGPWADKKNEKCDLEWTKFSRHGSYKGPFTRSVFKDLILLVPKIETCEEHIENALPTHQSVILKKTDGNRTCSIWKMKGADKILHDIPVNCVIVLAPNWRFFVSSEHRIVWTYYRWPSDILTTKTEPWNRTVWTPASNFWTKNRIFTIGSCERALKCCHSRHALQGDPPDV